ncbi:MAG: hypothetical protein ACJAXJ_000531 [Colwellia sp.]
MNLGNNMNYFYLSEINNYLIDKLIPDNIQRTEPPVNSIADTLNKTDFTLCPVMILVMYESVIGCGR